MGSELGFGIKEKPVAKKKRKRVRHIPQRMCVGCRQVASKRTMTRIAKTPDGILVDPTGKTAGRGVYLHDDRECWTVGLQGTIARALKSELSDQEKKTLLSYMENLPLATESN